MVAAVAARGNPAARAIQPLTAVTGLSLSLQEPRAGSERQAHPMSVYPEVIGAEAISSVTGCSWSFRTVRVSSGATRTNVPAGAG